MLEAAIASSLAKVLARTLLESTGLPATARQLAQVPIDHLLSRSVRSASKKSIESIAKEVAAELLAFPRALEDNAGSARSAADTLLEVLASASITVVRLIELNLDPTSIERALLEAGEKHLNSASAERRGHVERAIAKLSALLVRNAPELPGVQVAFMQAMLRSRRSEA